MQSNAYTCPKTGARVHRLSTVGFVPPEPKTDSFRAPRMGNCPRGPKSSAGIVDDTLRLHNPRSACVAMQSYESANYPRNSYV